MEIDVNQQPRIVSFVMDQPFDEALRMLRRVLALDGLRVPLEFDTTASVRQDLGVDLKQHRVLYVDDPIRLLEATIVNDAGGLYVPEPVVLSRTDPGCRVSVKSIEPVWASDLPVSLRGAVSDLHERIVMAVQRIAQKETAVTEMSGRRTVPA